MIIKNISEAKAELSALVEAVQTGEDVVIGKAGVPVARLIPFRKVTERVPGRLKGKIRISPDFDELPADMAEAFGMKP